MAGIRRLIVSAVAGTMLFAVLLYTEQPVIIPLKEAVSALGIIDSERVLVGIADIRSDDHRRGDPNAEVVIIEYSDFNCVMCAAMQHTFKKLVQDKKVLLISRHYPSIGKASFDRAIAAECVAQDAGETAYNAFVGYLYRKQHGLLSEEMIVQEAVSLGADATIMARCMVNEETRWRVERDRREAVRLGATGTPYIVIVQGSTPVGISYAMQYQDFVARLSKLTGI